MTHKKWAEKRNRKIMMVQERFEVWEYDGCNWYYDIDSDKWHATMIEGRFELWCDGGSQWLYDLDKKTWHRIAIVPVEKTMP